MKFCSKCGIEKSSKDFCSHKTTKNKLSSWCKECRKKAEQSLPYKERRKEYNKNNREKILNYQKEYYKNHKEKLSQKEKERKLKKYYNISFKEKQERLKNQNNKCALCEENFDFIKKNSIHIDHCHKTNIVRGILCNNCNSGLGRFKDNIELLEKAILYLKKYRSVAQG